MMKRLVGILMLVVVMMSFTGCSMGCSQNEKQASDSSDINTASKDSVAEKTATGGVDVDLATLSSTMVYSEVYNMMRAPEKYIGKTIKMKGAYNLYHDEVTGNDYYTCLIADATACCQQGIEFDLIDKSRTLNQGDNICVSGTFDTYKEGEYTYCVLRDAVLI